MTLLIAGLGNPGTLYSQTRHNIGYLVVDCLAEKLGTAFQKKNSLENWIAAGKTENTEPIILIKPATFMNESGRSVQKALSFYQLRDENLCVVMDDLDLPFGTLRIRLKGSHGGHNGLKSIENNLGNNRWTRIRMGIGNAHSRVLKSVKSRSGIRDFVLSAFLEEEKQKLSFFCELGAEAVFDWIRKPCSKTMNLAQL
ncbi:MAG: aminoacyl-tRNA hydrolase [Candidatus Aureabacteria bacterium]|nr:aminoacyl-tRNA hydrolase [Candidatus Auribacterota bacterium]